MIYERNKVERLKEGYLGTRIRSESICPVADKPSGLMGTVDYNKEEAS